MTCRWRSERAALPAAALLLLAGAPATAQDATVRDLILPVEDLTLRSSSLDNSVSTEESNRRVEVTLAADVLFRFDSAELTGKAGTRIAEAAAKVRDEEPSVVRVVGYTDSKGSAAYNLGLSRRRAAALTRALRDELGGDAPPLSTRGRGEADPVAPNQKPNGTDNPRGRALNRRVEVVWPR